MLAVLVYLVAWLPQEPPQKLRIPPLARCRVDSSSPIRAGKDHWTVDCYRCDTADVDNYEAEAFVVVRKNGKEADRWAPRERPGIAAYPVDIDPGYPVFAVRGSYGLGSHWDTMLFAIRDGRLIRMGQPPAMNANGPILWKGRKDLWAFDNYDRYGNRDSKFRLARVLMKVGKDGKLRPYSTTRTPHPRVPTTIHTPDDLLNVPKGGF